MSSGKLRRERSASRERPSWKEGDKRRDTHRQEKSPEVRELNEEEYDEEWEHEWEDIDDIAKDRPKYQKPFVKYPNPKWRGRYNSRGQNRFNKWDNRNYSAGSDRGSESNRKTGHRDRDTHPDDDENLDMPPGEEMTNLKVKIQDGKRFAEPHEREDPEMVTERRNYPKFSRGRGSRGYHAVSRERWAQGSRFKRSNPEDLLDCREVLLNRRKRHHPDSVETDLREKLIRKDSDLGDLREIIESRDHGGDLRDLIIEPPDMSLMDEFSELTEDIVGEVDHHEDINLMIQNEYFDELHGPGSERQGHAGYIIGSDHYELEEQDLIEKPRMRDVIIREEEEEEDLQQGRWKRSMSRERSFVQHSEWRERNRIEGSWERSRLHAGSPDGDRRIIPHGRSPRAKSPSGRRGDRPRNESRERVKSPQLGNFRERSFERLGKPRDVWERERGFLRKPSRGQGPNLRAERGGRGSFGREIRGPGEEMGRLPFSPDRGGISPVGAEHMPPMQKNRGLLRSPPLVLEREKYPGWDRSRPRLRSISPDVVKAVSSEIRRSPGRIRSRHSQERKQNRRSLSADRDRMMSRERNRSIGRDRKRSPGVERNWGSNRNMDQDIVRERNRSLEQVRSVSRERNRSFDLERNRNLVQERNRSFDQGGNRIFNQERGRNFNQERSRDFGQERNKDIAQESVRDIEHERNKNFDPSRNRIPNRDRKGSMERELVKSTRWDSARSTSRDRSPRLERGNNLGRDRPRSPLWGGPRTPSVESFREAGWGRSRSPARNRVKSPARERSRSRGRLTGIPPARMRENSGGRELQGRSRDQKEKDSSRPKEQERREKTQDQGRRRDQELPPNRTRESGPMPFHNSVKDSSTKLERSHKRELEESASKDRGRERQRSAERHHLPDKGFKKTPQMLLEEFKEKHIRDTNKPEKYPRKEDFLPKHMEQGPSGGHKEGAREWENIRDYQERRNMQTVVGLPFFDESRRQREDTSRTSKKNNEQSRNEQPRNDQSRNLTSRGPRSQPQPEPHLHESQAHLSSTGTHQIKDQSMSWQNQGNNQIYNHQELDKRRWGSPPRREKLSDHTISHKPVTYSTQNVAIGHQSSSNGKADNNHWRRDLPSHGESQWSKPRSDLSTNAPNDPGITRTSPSFARSHKPSKEVIFVRGLARDITDMDLRKDVSECGLWPKDVRVVFDNDTGVSRGLAFITFNSVDEATRWMDVRKGVLNLRPNNHAAMEFSNPTSRDWECSRCLTVNFKYRSACYQCNRSKDDCLDGWEETCPYPTNALLLRGLNPLTSTSEIIEVLKPRLIAQARLDGVRMGVDAKGRPRSVCYVQLTSVTDSMSLHKSLVKEPLVIDNCQVVVSYCQLDKLPQMDVRGSQMLPSMPLVAQALPPAIPLSLPPTLPTNNIPVVSRATAAPNPTPNPTPAPASAPTPALKPVNVSTAVIRSMLEGNYTEKDIPVLAQYCATAYAKNPQEQAVYIRYYTKHYREKLLNRKNQTGGK